MGRDGMGWGSFCMQAWDPGAASKPGPVCKKLRRSSPPSPTLPAVPLKPQPRMSTAQGSSPCASSSGKPRRHSRHELQQGEHHQQGGGTARAAAGGGPSPRSKDGNFFQAEPPPPPLARPGPPVAPLPPLARPGPPVKAVQEEQRHPGRARIVGDNAAAPNRAGAQGREDRETAEAAEEPLRCGVLNVRRPRGQEGRDRGRGEALRTGAQAPGPRGGLPCPGGQCPPGGGEGGTPPVSQGARGCHRLRHSPCSLPDTD